MLSNLSSTELRSLTSRRHALIGAYRRSERPRISKVPAIGIVASIFVLAAASFVPAASGAQTVQLATAAPFAVLGATEVTDVPTSSITGDVGLSPAAGTNYTGLTKAEVNGTIYTTDGTGPAHNVDDPDLLTTAKHDLTTAYLDAKDDPATTTFNTLDNQLGGQTLVPGVYAFGHANSFNITEGDPLVLNGEGNVNAVFIFKATSDLTTAPGSVVSLENGAQACNVFWQVGSSATLNSSSTFVGTIMALTSATLLSGATVQGRVLVRNGAVTLDANTITAPSTCATSSTTTTTSAPVGTTTTTAAPVGTTTTTTTAAPVGTTTTTTAAPVGTTTTTAAPVGTTTTTTTAAPVGTTTTTPAGGSPASTGTGSGGGSGTITSSSGTTSGGEAATGTGAAAGTAGALSSTVVPTGFPHTGFGGAAHSRNDGLIGLGSLGLFGSAGMLVVAVRRRHAFDTLHGTHETL